MREVAHPEWGNFRGVCPILNRAKELGRHQGYLRILSAAAMRVAAPELRLTPAIAGFYVVPI